MAFALPDVSGQTTCGVDDACLTFALPSSYKCVTGNFTVKDLYASNILLPPSSAATTAQFLVVDGVITFNEDYTFAPGSELIFYEGSGLDVNSGYELIITESYLHGCENLWAGINVRPGGNIRLTDNDIEDAYTGVRMEAGGGLAAPSGIAAIGNRFRKDHIGILLGTGSTGARINLLAGGIAGNLFDGSVDPPALGSTPFVCLYGVAMLNVFSITIGNEAMALNTFTEYKKSFGADRSTGVYARFSNFTLVNSRFTNIGDPNDGNVGYAITIRNTYVSEKKATIKGLGNAGSSISTFENTEGCIWIDHGSIDVSQVQANTIRTGVHYQSFFAGPTPVNVKIDNCTFDQYTGNGIFMDWTWLPVDNFTVRNSRFIDAAADFRPFPGLDRYGVLIAADMPVPIFQTGSIDHNEFVNNDKDDEDEYRTGGVYLRNLLNGIVFENDIDDTDSQNTTTKDFNGIRLENCTGLTIRENDLLGTTLAYGTTKQSAGISVYESGGNLISCNDANYFRTGIGFEGSMCDGTEFVHNYMSNHNNGLLLLDSTTIIGQQRHKSNQWYGTASLEGNFAFAGFDPGDLVDRQFVELSKFFIQTTNQSSTLWANPRTIGGVADNNYWFEYQSSGTIEDYPCATTTCCDNTELTKGDERVIEDSFPAYEGGDAFHWDAEFRLYRHLSEEPSLLADSAADAWFAAQSSTNLPALYGAYRAVAGAGPDSAQWVQLSAAYDSLSTLLDLVYATDAEIGEDSTGSDETLLLAQRDSLMDLVIDQQAAYELLDSTVTVQVRQSASSSATALSGVTPANDHERYMKQVLEIQLDLLSTGDTLTQAQKDTLLAIAGKCRYTGGYGVVLARMMVDSTGFVDSTICGAEERSMGEAPNHQSRASAISVLPNPANDYFVLRIGHPFEQGRYMLFNAVGQVVRDENLSGTEVYVSAAGLPAGIYQLAIQVDAETVQVIKVLISR